MLGLANAFHVIQIQFQIQTAKIAHLLMGRLLVLNAKCVMMDSSSILLMVSAMRVTVL